MEPKMWIPSRCHRLRYRASQRTALLAELLHGPRLICLTTRIGIFQLLLLLHAQRYAQLHARKRLVKVRPFRFA